MKNNSFSSLLRNLFTRKKPLLRDPYSELTESENNTWIYREHEIHEQLPSIEFRTSSECKFELGTLLAELFNISKEEISDLSIIDDSLLKKIDTKDEIWYYDLLKPYYNDKPDFDKKHIFYSLIYRQKDLSAPTPEKSKLFSDSAIMIHCYPTGQFKGNTNYLKLTICFPSKNSHPADRHDLVSDATCHTYTIAYDFKRPSQAIAEYNYMRDAIDSYNDLKASSLTENEWLLLQHIRPEIGNEFYWGKKAFNSNRYLDAILYFRNVYDTLKDTWYKKGLNAKEMNLLTECSYLIGYSYNDLRLYDRAYHYLELAGRSNNKSYKYKKEFINCLVNSRNLLSIIYIDDYLQDLKTLPDNKRNEEDLKFFYFLLRRKAYILIEMEQFDDAEYILHRLLEKDPDNLIILKELAYIQHQRKQRETVAQEREEKHN